MAVVSINRVVRASSGDHTWLNFGGQLRATINLASELGLHPEQRILERALAAVNACRTWWRTWTAIMTCSSSSRKSCPTPAAFPKVSSART